MNVFNQCLVLAGTAGGQKSSLPFSLLYIRNTSIARLLAHMNVY